MVHYRRRDKSAWGCKERLSISAGPSGADSWSQNIKMGVRAEDQERVVGPADRRPGPGGCGGRSPTRSFYQRQRKQTIKARASGYIVALERRDWSSASAGAANAASVGRRSSACHMPDQRGLREIDRWFTHPLVPRLPASDLEIRY
jgi:hypothetical protein